MRSTPRSMRRFWIGCLILLALLAVVSGGGVLVGGWLPDDRPGEAIVAAGWGLLGPLLAAGLLGGLLFWRGRRLLLGTLCSCGLLLLVATAWAGTDRHNGQAAAVLRYEYAGHARTLGCQLISSGGRLGILVGSTVVLLPYSRDDHGTYHPSLQLVGGWWAEAWGELIFDRAESLDWRWLRWCGFEVTGPRRTSNPWMSESAFGLVVPYWFVVPWLLIYPALYGWMCWKLAHAPMSPRCANCGYDLRGHAAADGRTAAGSKCPECGTEIPALPATKAAGTSRQG